MVTDAKWLLVSDVDDTLVGDDHALEEFADILVTIRDKVIVVYNSGRPCASLRKTFDKKPILPIPDFLIGAVGTEIEKEVTGEVLIEYRERLIKGWYRKKITSLIDDMGFQPHPYEFQTRFKVSYDVFEEEEYKEIVQRLNNAGLSAKVIYSSRKNLDIIPRKGGKGNAIEFLRYEYNISPYSVIVAGDSGNDIEMFAKPNKGIIVGNAASELKRLTGDYIYHANRKYAKGVVEGLKYWHVLS